MYIIKSYAIVTDWSNILLYVCVLHLTNGVLLVQAFLLVLFPYSISQINHNQAFQFVILVHFHCLFTVWPMI